MIITHSSLECFKTCKQKYKLRYFDKIIPKQKSRSLEIGTVWHLMLEEYLKLLDASNALDQNIDESYVTDKCIAIAEKSNLDEIEKAKLIGLIIGYIKRWLEFDRLNFEVVSIEKEFTQRFGMCDFVGKIDGLLKRKSDGEYIIIEHKTASLVDDDFISQKDIDSQTLTYAIMIEKVMGIQIHGIIHDIAEKQKIRQKKSESTEEFCNRLIEDVSPVDNFTRIFVYPRRDLLDEFEDELYSACYELNSCENFYKCTGSCLGKYGACEYLPICKAGGLARVNKEVLQNYESLEPHEEISKQTLQTEQED